jgi:hypothetical protein
MKKFTILIAAVALVCFAAPAMAVDWDFYGNARMATFYTSEDIEDNGPITGTTNSSEDTDLRWDLQGNSRFGANVKAENIKAQVEMGIGESNVSARRVYGVWNFGAGTMKVGKDYTPTSQFISGQVFDSDLGLLGTGTNYGGRHGQLAFSFGSFEIALVNMNTGSLSNLVTTSTALVTATSATGGPVTIPLTATTSANGDVKRILPKLELGWGMGFDSWNFNLMGGAQYYSISDVESDVDGSTDDLDVTSYIIGGDVGWNFGPGFLKAAVSYGQNIGNAGWTAGGTGTYGGQGGTAIWDGDDDTNDTTTAQAALVAGLKMSDMFSFEAGAGIRGDATDGDNGLARNTTPWAAYLQSVIALAPGVYIIPEVGYYDYDNNTDGDDAGSSFYLGGKWQINF